MVEVEEKVYNLVLDYDELITLGAILARIGGSPDNTRRKQTQAIFDAIANRLECEKIKADKILFNATDITGNITMLSKNGKPYC
jgi:hypothetical protein